MTKVNNTYTYYKIQTLMECLIWKIKILYNPTHQKRNLSNTYFFLAFPLLHVLNKMWVIHYFLLYKLPFEKNLKYFAKLYVNICRSTPFSFLTATIQLYGHTTIFFNKWMFRLFPIFMKISATRGFWEDGISVVFESP